MSEVYFYHMTRTPLEGTLPVLLVKSLQAGWKVLLRGTDEARLSWLLKAAVMGVLFAVLTLVFIAFLVGGRLERLLGDTGINVVTRLLGMLLAALAVQFVLDGLADFGFVS